MPHIDQILNAQQRHDGVLPASWLTGDTEYQKAAVIAAVAWNDIKAPTDPDLVHADLTFRENCIGVVESIMRGNEPDSTPFAQAAARRWSEINQPPTKEIATP